MTKSRQSELNLQTSQHTSQKTSQRTKVFIVTGAASGIGLALAQRLLSLGHCVCACDVNAADLQQRFADQSASNQLMLNAFDIRDNDAWQTTVSAVIKQWQRIDVLCNVAGILRDNWIPDIQATEIDLHFDINVKGTILGCQHVIPHMQQQHEGHIINLASLAGLAPVPGLSLYSASKYAVRAFSLAAAIELRQYGIAVTTICPDAVQTPMLDQQKSKPQAALTFSGLRTLSTDDVVDSILEVLNTQAIEVMLPFERGAIAKVANAFPVAAGKLNGIMSKIGNRRRSRSK